MMTQYAKVSFWAILFGLVMLPIYVSAASITEKSAAIGEGCVADGENSTAMGLKTTASGYISTAMGYKTIASKALSTAMGSNARAEGMASTAMGWETLASGEYSTAMGYYTTAGGDYSTAMGLYTKASAVGATIIGHGNGAADNLRLINNVVNSFMVGYMTNSSDITPEFFVKHGGVGINTTNPSTSLHVKRDISGYADLENHVAAIENTSTDASPDVLMLKVNIENPNNGNNFITFSDSTKLVGAIEGNGSGGIQLNTSGGDFAEYLRKSNPNEALKPGDIVGLFSEGVSKKTENAQRLMVVSTAPAVLGNRPVNNINSAYAPVAFLGQVPVKVIGSFSAGDFIIPSGRADGIGIAVSPKAITPSQYASVIGRTLNSHKAKGLNEAIVMVGLPQHELWNGIIKKRDARIAKLENRLAALESKRSDSIDIGLLPGAGLLVGSLGFLWVDRKRRLKNYVRC